MRTWLIAALLGAIAFSKCVVPVNNLGINVPKNEVLEIGLLARVYVTKVKANILLVKPDNPYRAEILKAVKLHYDKAKESLTIAERDYVAGLYDKAFIYYLVAFEEAYLSYHLLNTAKYNDLTQLANALNRPGEVASSLAYASLKLALKPEACANVTRVVYVYNYYLFRNLTRELNYTLSNFPGSLNAELAKSVVSIYKKLSKLLAYTVLQSYMQTWGATSEAKLPPLEGKCVSGIGPQTQWLPRACYVVENARANGSIKYPCQKAVGALAYLMGDEEMVRVMCSLG